MNIEGTFIPTWLLAVGVIGFIGTLWSMHEKAWGTFTFFLAIGFCSGLTIYFKLLGI